MALQQHTLMDKTMMVVLGFLVVGIPIAFLQPDTGELRDQPLYLLFYASIGGIIVSYYVQWLQRKESQTTS